MHAALATFALTAPLVLAGGEAERALGFPEIVISKAGTKHEWPFSIDKGNLACIRLGNQQVVLFSEILTSEEMGEIGNMKLPRSVIVSSNPIALFASHEDRALYAPWDSLETLIKRLAPFETMGHALCGEDHRGQDL